MISRLPGSLRSDDRRRESMRDDRTTEGSIVSSRACGGTDDHPITLELDLISWGESEAKVEHFSISTPQIIFIESS